MISVPIDQKHDVDVGGEVVLEHRQVVKQPDTEILPGEVVEGKRAQHGRQQDHVTGGHDPQHPPPEVDRQAISHTRRAVPEQDPPDQVSTEDEEQVHADPAVEQQEVEPSRLGARRPQPRAMAMTGKHQSDRRATQKVEPGVFPRTLRETQITAQCPVSLQRTGCRIQRRSR